MTRRVIRLLFLPREAYPTDRVRINVLFGRELLARGHQIDLAMQAQDQSVPTGANHWFGRSVFVGVTDDRRTFVHLLRKHWLALRHDLGMLRRSGRERYDAILVSDKFLIAIIGLWLARRRSLKFIFWLTFPYPEVELAGASDGTARYPWLAKVRGLLSGWVLYRWIVPRSDHVFVQSERMKRNVCLHGADPEKMSAILTGFDLGEVAAVERGTSVGPRAGVTLAYLGTLNGNRHLGVLIDTLARLVRAGIDAKLLLVGDADKARDREHLQQHAARLGVADRLEITGALPQLAAWRRIVAADICLSPIHRTPIFDVGSPTKLIEYLALGMPVVANDHPEQRAILRESRAGVCVPWGARHFERAVRWLLRRSTAERSAMGAKGRAWVEAHRTYRGIADAVERTCIEVIYGADEREPDGARARR